MPTTSFYFADLARRNERQQRDYRERQRHIRRQMGEEDEADSVSTRATTTDEEGLGWRAGLARQTGGEHYLY